MTTCAKLLTREKRKKRIRKSVIGTAECPRMSVFRSIKQLYVQFINDLEGKTVISCSTVSKDFNAKYPKSRNNKETAKKLGDFAAEKALGKGIKKIVFDRSGYKYHGRIKELADAARKKGLIF